MQQTEKIYNSRLSIDSQLEHVRLLGSALRGIGADLSLLDEEVGQLELLLVEAVNNVIEHAYEFEPGNDVHIRVECKPADNITIIISDKGRSIPAGYISQLQNEPVAFPDPASLPEGGWGLGLISLLADSLHYEHDYAGNHLHVSKQLTSA